jgi:hypothetical protein
MPIAGRVQQQVPLVLAVALVWLSLIGYAVADDWGRLSRGEVYVPEDLLRMPQVDAALRDRLGDAYADYVDVVGREQNFDPDEDNLRRGILTGLSWSPDLRFPAQVTRIQVDAREVFVVLWDASGRADYFPARADWPEEALAFVDMIQSNLQQP